MKFLVDESVDRQVVDRLRMDGYEVWYVTEMDPGIPDDFVLNRANQELAILVTADKDFGELVFRQKRISKGVFLPVLLVSRLGRRLSFFLSPSANTCPILKTLLP